MGKKQGEGPFDRFTRRAFIAVAGSAIGAALYKKGVEPFIKPDYSNVDNVASWLLEIKSELDKRENRCEQAIKNGQNLLEQNGGRDISDQARIKYLRTHLGVNPALASSLQNDAIVYIEEIDRAYRDLNKIIVRYNEVMSRAVSHGYFFSDKEWLRRVQSATRDLNHWSHRPVSFERKYDTVHYGTLVRDIYHLKYSVQDARYSK